MFKFSKSILIRAAAIVLIGFSPVFTTDMLKALSVRDASAAPDRTTGQQQYGILGHTAPELNLSTWIDANGQATGGIRLSALRGKVIYLYFFQHWCPGCHAHGFPTLQTIAQTFKGDHRVVLVAVQTAFEGKSINTLEKLRKNQIQYNLAIPMAHDAGEGNRRVPQTMIDYRSGGTPWTVIIDPDGKVVYNQFHIASHQAIELIKALRK